MSKQGLSLTVIVASIAKIQNVFYLIHWNPPPPPPPSHAVRYHQNEHQFAVCTEFERQGREDVSLDISST